MSKFASLFALCLVLALLQAGVAAAHVTVYPLETTQGSYEKFAVRVPNEKDIPTVKVEVRFPTDAVSISRFEPKPGWKYEIAKDEKGNLTGVTWTATGDGLLPTEFAEFYMQGKVADQATQITWKAYQTYKDGSVVEWTGAAGSQTPASVTVVKAKPAGAASGDGHDHGGAHGPAAGQSDVSAGADGSGFYASSRLSLYLSVAALALGLAALIVALTKKTAR
jgi:uncharacterized protein YcnI